MIMADRVQMRRVRMNLIVNGIEAMKGTDGALTVKSQLHEDRPTQILVHDTDLGLPLGKADKIFDALFTTRAQGNGMGLAICQSSIASQGDRIWANGRDGRCASFHFTLPPTSRRSKQSRPCHLVLRVPCDHDGRKTKVGAVCGESLTHSHITVFLPRRTEIILDSIYYDCPGRYSDNGIGEAENADPNRI